MIITLLWEDQRGTETKGFGPHELLVACLADDTEMQRYELRRIVESHPKKGNANVRAALQRDGVRLSNSGPVVAIVDRDKIQDLWKQQTSQPPNCMTGIGVRFRQDAPSTYDLVFLIRNVETLIAETCKVLGEPEPTGKPTPDERDIILTRMLDSRQARDTLRANCPSFDRIVKRVAKQLPAPARK